MKIQENNKITIDRNKDSVDMLDNVMQVTSENGIKVSIPYKNIKEGKKPNRISSLFNKIK